MNAALRRMTTSTSLRGGGSISRALMTRKTLLDVNMPTTFRYCPKLLAARFPSSSSSSSKLCFSTSNNDKGGKEYHEMFEKQIQDLESEREAIFGFTEDDHNAWSNSKSHQHSTSFMDEINQARQEQLAFEAATTATTPSMPPAKENNSQASTVTTAGSADSGAGFAGLSHLSTDGTSVHMVNVGEKKVTPRVAVAQSKVFLPNEVVQAFAKDKNNADLVGPKGPIFATAKVAGIMAAKKTSELIPLCHPLPLDSVNIDISLQEEDDNTTVVIQCECHVTHKTGVEMEALTGASVAALTIYDMTKAVSHDIQIAQTRLLSKAGGKTTFVHTEDGDGEANKKRKGIPATLYSY